MTIVDLIIIVFIILGIIIGFKQGAIKTGVNFVGICLVTIIAFVFKDKLMVLLYEHLPFFNFFGLIRGITATNILFYQIISFIIIFMALTFVLRVLIAITGLIEWLLKMTIFLSLPSKILGAVIGGVQYYVYVFLVLYILNFPVLNLEILKDSKLNNFILNNTPVISGYVSDTVDTYSKVYSIIRNRKNKTDSEINTEVLITLLDNRLISVESARKLVFQNKVIITDEKILDNYKESELYNYLDDQVYSKIGGQ